MTTSQQQISAENLLTIIGEQTVENKVLKMNVSKLSEALSEAHKEISRLSGDSKTEPFPEKEA